MKRQRSRWEIGLILIVCAAMVLAGCGKNVEEEKGEEAILVDTQLVTTGNLTLTNSFIGTISPEETVAVFPMASGLVTDTYFEVGDAVSAGDVLFQIDDEIATIQAQQARLSAEQAQLSAESTLNTQQDAQNLQLEQAAIAAQSNYEQAQIAYVQTKDAYHAYDDQVDAAKNAMDAANQGVAAAKANMEEKEKEYLDAKAAYDADTANLALQQAAEQAKAVYDGAMTAYVNAQSAASGATAAYNSAKSGKESMRMSFYQAQSAYKAAERNREITEETSNLTQQEVYEDTAAQLQVGIDMANLSADSAAIALSYCTVTAPISGIIESKNVEVNGMAGAGTPSYTIVNNHTMTVTYYVSEKIKSTCQIGQKILLERNGNTYDGVITEIGNSVDPQAGLFKVKACVSASGAELPSGVTVKITADTYAASEAIIIPYDAVYYDNGGSYVYLNVDDRAVKHYVGTGIFDEENIVISQGLSVGDEVVTSWSPKLTAGVLLTSTKDQQK